MAIKSTKARRGIGRPPAGAREGEKVKDYPQLSIRLPGETRAKLQALSVVGSKSQWRLVSEAIECYFRERPEAERRQVEEVLRSRARSGTSKKRS